MKPVKHLLISRTDKIGDVVLTLPLAGYLKEAFPGVRLSFIGRTYTEPVVSLSMHVDRFINLDLLESKPFKEQKSELERVQADWILHAYPNPKLALLALAAGIPHRAGTSHRLAHLLLCNELVHFSRRRSDLHEAELNFKLLRPMGVENAPPLSSLPAYYGFREVSPSTAVASLRDPHRFNLILHPRSRGSAREWGLDNFERLIRILPERRYKVFVTGTREEGQSMRDFLARCGDRVVDLTGRLSLAELIECIAAADGLVAASTGPLHLAAALGKKAVGIYAPMRPIHPGRWAPLGAHAKALALEIECESCRKGGECACMRRISAEEVLGALETA